MNFSCMSMSDVQIKTLLLCADNDGIFSQESVLKGAENLPKNLTKIKNFAGGNHTNFAHLPLIKFTCCFRDKKSLTTTDEQIKFVVDEMILFLNSL